VGIDSSTISLVFSEGATLITYGLAYLVVCILIRPRKSWWFSICIPLLGVF